MVLHRSIFSLLFFLLMGSFIFGQDVGSSMMYDSSVLSLEDAIRYSQRKHALYSYNIANATTQGFEPILMPEDQSELFSMVPANSEYFRKVLLEHMTTNMARNRNKHQALLLLYKKKFENYRMVATLGKK